MNNYISKVTTPKISIAPMVDRTDRHFRYFLRGITKKSLLYTEMITSQAILNGDLNKLLDFNKIEKPLSLQIAGSTPDEIYEAVKLADSWDYDEVNLNVGCPSNRVSGNSMGACLMAYPELVKEMLFAMKEATNKPVTVKHRIGIDGTGILPDNISPKIINRYDNMVKFVDTISAAKIDRFTIHARIAILKGLSPRENREIPPIRYEDVYKFKKDFPHLNIDINGSIKTPDDIENHLKYVDGVMIGRASYEDPFMLRSADKFFDSNLDSNISRADIINWVLPYVEDLENKGENPNLILKHTLALFFNEKGTKQWKQLISPPFKDTKASERVKLALKSLPEETLYFK
ncbi:tRNA dihydrouridine(20/20a) synthase DusA [Clostridium frigidicarnis]|uniref:tRNA-dihydrouridine(20/20a) synthase n=1 Tax=Clostridium frigidicarnis TaxID=84698 RepID=A0A1I0YS51_9CLOT|nr:tRNA dihydrouridine(20/20a) synthase DusA [Clostridium frigidicarnis]SFB15270.1 tRNA-dihydrouridine synthase A [Clostridium frigidicarnis]